MPPTLVRPQTFTVLQQPDSASPAVQFVSEQNSYLICVLQGCISHCPVSLSQSANCLVRVPLLGEPERGRIRFSAPSEKPGTSTVRLSVPVVWVGHRPLPLLYNLRNQLCLKILPRIWRWAALNLIQLAEPPRCKQESSKPCPAFLSPLDRPSG